MRHIALTLITVMTVVASHTASASQLLCVFDHEGSGSMYSVEFHGYTKSQGIIFRSPQAWTDVGYLPGDNYTLRKLDPKARVVDLTFDRGNNESLPPSFELKGSKDNVLLTIGTERIVGKLFCGF